MGTPGRSAEDPLDFRFTPEQEAFRQEVVGFIRKELPANLLAGDFPYSDKNFEATMAFRKKLGQKKWTGIGWPKEYGGLGALHTTQAIFHEEMIYHNAPLDPQAYQVGPAIIAYGSDYLKRKFLAGTVTQDIVWCQGFSEPNAGSDLANLQTSAVADGDDFIINGQKIWTSLGHKANWIHILVRTDPKAPKHKGISYFVVDMKSPGVTIRPLVNMADLHEFNEVFFTNVRVPRQNMIGELNQGWYVAMTTLENERSGARDLGNVRRMLDQVLRIYQSTKGHPGIRHDVVAKHRLAEMAIELAVTRQLAFRVSWMHEQKLPMTREPSIVKMFGTDLQQRVTQLGMQVQGLYGQTRHGSRRALEDGIVAHEYLHAISTPISAGSNEVQRNIIATRGLGLPRG